MPVVTIPRQSRPRKTRPRKSKPRKPSDSQATLSATLGRNSARALLLSGGFAHGSIE